MVLREKGLRLLVYKISNGQILQDNDYKKHFCLGADNICELLHFQDSYLKLGPFR